MKLKFIFLLVTLLALPAMSFAKPLELKIKGISLNSTYSTVIKNLGKPVSKKTHDEGEDSCAPGKFITLKYDGLEIELWETWKKVKDYKVVSITITSNKWKFSNGVGVGATQKLLQSKFGKPYKTETRSGEKWVTYLHKGEEASAGFIFRKGKLVKILISEFLC